MKIRSPSLVELHAFLAVCRCGSFRQAAEALCVTQAAVSRAVQRLEEHLGGHRLFDRSAQGVVLTERGRLLRELTEQPVQALERATEAMDQAAPAQQVRLSVIPTLGTQWLMPRLPAFQAAHPAIAITLRQFKHDEDFSRDDVDLWIEVKRPQRPWPAQLDVHYLLGRETLPVCAPWLRDRLRQPQDLLAVPLLHHTKFPDNWQRWLQQAGVDSAPHLGPGFDLTINLIVAAKAGMGVAVVPGCLVEKELLTGELVVPFDTTLSNGRGYFLCRHRSRPLSQAQQAFAHWVQEQAGLHLAAADSAA